MNKLYKALGRFAFLLLCSFFQQCTQDVPTPASRPFSTVLDALTNPVQKKLAQERISQSAFASRIASGEVVVVLIKIPVTTSGADSIKLDTTHALASKYQQQTVCYNYYLVYYTNGIETDREFLFTDCTTIGGDDGSGGGSGDGSGSGGGGGGGGGGGNAGLINAIKNEPNLTPGPKPLAFYPDRCSGAQGLWNLGVSNNNVEAFGYLTPTGQLIATAVLGANGGNVGPGLYPYNSGAGTSYYYYYPVSQGPLAQSIPGTLQILGNYYIPVSATVHTHTPCLLDGTDGISNHILSPDDQSLANGHPVLHNYIIGCSAVGSFNAGDTSPTLLGSGALSTICSLLQ